MLAVKSHNKNKLLLLVLVLHLHDSNTVTLVDHVDETVSVSRSTFQLVGDRLVSGPPFTTLDMFIGRGNLNTTETFGTQNLKQKI